MLGQITRWSKHVVGQAYEVHGVPALVDDLDERDRVVSLDDRADRPSGPAPGARAELDYIENRIGRHGHDTRSSQQLTRHPSPSGDF